MMGELLAISLFLLAAIDIGSVVFFYIKNGVEELGVGDRNELYKCVFQGMFKIFFGIFLLVENMRCQGTLFANNLYGAKWAFIIQICWGLLSFIGGYAAYKKEIKPVDNQKLSNYFLVMSIVQGFICIVVGTFGLLYAVFL